MTTISEVKRNSGVMNAMMSFLLQRIEALSISQSRAPVLNKIAQRRLAARLIAAWGHGELPLKRAGQMALIGKAGHEGGIGGE
jgi:hypothetical protein